MFFDLVGTIESKYAAITPMAGLNPWYFNLILQKNIDEFISKYLADLNIKLNDLKLFPIENCNYETQKTVARVIVFVSDIQVDAGTNCFICLSSNRHYCNE